MKKSFQNPENIPNWDKGASDDYIRECYKLYQENVRSKYSIDGHFYGSQEFRYYSSCHREYSNSQYHYYSEKADWIYINFLYREGRSRKVLNCDYEQFAKYLINGFQRRWIRYSHIKAPFRQKHENTKWKDKGKKILSEEEQNKREWRDKKGIDRDNKKSGWRRSGAPKWIKQYSNKLHRQWEREKIHNGEWDDMGDKDYKYFLDPWMWD